MTVYVIGHFYVQYIGMCICILFAVAQCVTILMSYANMLYKQLNHRESVNVEL